MTKKIIFLVAIMLIGVVVLVGCANASATISFNTNGGSDVESVTKDVGDSITAPAEPTREGYAFEGWYTDEALTREYAFSYVGSGDITLYAKWVDEYAVTLIANGGEGIGITTYKVGEDTALPTNYTRAGYVFQGWYDNVECAGDAITSIAKGSKGDKTYYAKWTEAEPTYHINLVTGSGVDRVGGDLLESYTSGTKVDLPLGYTREGYLFGGWYDNIDYAGDAIESVDILDADITLYAKWIGDYAVTLVDNGGLGTPLTSYAVDKGASLPNNWIRDGYRFGGWYESQDLSGEAVTAIPRDAKGDKTFYAKWDKLYKVNLVTGEGDTALNEEFSGEYIEGEKVELPFEPTKVGYAFSGWYERADYDDFAVINLVMGTSDVTLYAKWTPNNHFVTLDIAEANNYPLTAGVVYGQRVHGLPTPVNNSRDVSFNGWYYDPDFTNICTGLEVGDEDITLYGQWSEGLLSQGYLPYEEKFAKATSEYITIYTAEELGKFVEYIIFKADKSARYYVEIAEIDTALSVSEIEKYMVITAHFNNTNSNSGFEVDAENGSNRMIITNYRGFDPDNIRPVDNQYTITQIDNPAFGDINPMYKRASNFSDFAYKQYKTSLEVQNTSQLFYALQYGIKPIPVVGSKAEAMLLEAEDILRNIITDNMTAVEKAYAIYSWVINSTAYDHKALTTSGQYGDVYSAFHADGVFSNGISVCDGISKAYAILANMEGIPCVRAISFNHAWNKVYLDADSDGYSEWYVVDCTWGNMEYGNIIDANVKGHEMILLDEFLITDAGKASYGQESIAFKDKVANTVVDAYTIVKTTRSGKNFDYVIESDEDLTATLTDLHYIFNVDRIKDSRFQQNASDIISISFKLARPYVDSIRVPVAEGEDMTSKVIIPKIVDICKNINGLSSTDKDFKTMDLKPLFKDGDMRKYCIINIVFKSSTYKPPQEVGVVDKVA